MQESNSAPFGRGGKSAYVKQLKAVNIATQYSDPSTPERE
jgi:hypothetical protein